MRFRSLRIDYKAEAMQVLKEENETRKQQQQQQQQQQQRYRNKRTRRDKGDDIDNDDQDISSCRSEEESSFTHQRQHHRRPRVIRILVDNPHNYDDDDQQATNFDDTPSEAKKEATATPGSTTNQEVPFWHYPLVDSNQNCKSSGDAGVVDANKVTPLKSGNADSTESNNAVNCGGEDNLAETLGCMDYDVVSSTTPNIDSCNSSILTNACCCCCCCCCGH
jgi:hypothetical protein